LGDFGIVIPKFAFQNFKIQRTVPFFGMAKVMENLIRQNFKQSFSGGFQQGFIPSVQKRGLGQKKGFLFSAGSLLVFRLLIFLFYVLSVKQ
jgi:hypothetical protein